MTWQDRANCIGVDPDVMFPDAGRGAAEEARAVCQGCQVRQECLDYAIEHGERHGIWGGLTPLERRPLRRHWIAEQGLELTGTGRVKARHGSISRYRSGCRCDECRSANAEKQRRARRA